MFNLTFFENTRGSVDSVHKTLAYPSRFGIQRRQFPTTPAYPFTDYRSQGQTLRYVMVDIATPPSGTLSLFNLYVALSRSSGRDTIRLLRDFDDKFFMAAHDPALLMEDDHIAQLDTATKQWYLKVIKDPIAP